MRCFLSECRWNERVTMSWTETLLAVMVGFAIGVALVIVALGPRRKRISNAITRNSVALAAFAKRLEDEERRIISELDERLGD